MSRTCPACGVYIGHIPEHPCSVYRKEPELPPERTDTTFLREGRNSAEGLERYRHYLEGEFTDD